MPSRGAGHTSQRDAMEETCEAEVLMPITIFPRSQQDKVVILAVSRNPASLYKALLECTLLQPIRESLVNAGLGPELPCGALMLVRPHQYSSVELMAPSLGLKRSDLVISADIEEHVTNIIRCVKEKVRIRSRRPLPLGSLLYAKNQQMPVRVKHTFLMVDSASSQSAAKTASTTDADCRKGPPPRKC